MPGTPSVHQGALYARISPLLAHQTHASLFIHSLENIV